MQLNIHAATKERWADLEKLFGKQGACNGCWCMYWRIGPEYHKRDRLLNKAELRKMVSGNQPVGLLAYHNDLPVGWCQLTPKQSLSWLIKNGYGNLEESKAWCISCFYIKSGYRRKGVTSTLVKAAVAHAENAGADLLEAYPGKSPNSYTGYATTFVKAGFKIGEEAKYGRKVATYRFKK
jgi:GNAT superfamily N-acetyltransferase